MTEKRKRDQTLSIRLTQAEKDMLLDRVRRAGMTLTDFIVCAGLLISINAPPDLAPLLVEMKRAGNNINQIAMKIGSVPQTLISDNTTTTVNICQVVG